MLITGDVTVARLIEEHPELIEVLADYHPHFRQLRDARLRRVMAPRVSVAEAARMAGVAPEDLLAVLRRAVGDAEPPRPGGLDTAAAAPVPAEERPAALRRLPDARMLHVDVREDIRRGEEPFARIMAGVRALAPDQVLVLRAPFEPIPLYDVLGKRGLAHWTERHAPDDWSVWFYRGGGAGEGEGEGEAAPAEGGGAGADPVRVIDVRGLEPPQPMVRVLEAVDRLGPGARLEVLHDRRPVFLYPQLDERGFAHETDEPEPGLVRIVIRRPGDPR
jgi:uncharacterized protein (DUF2249 family)